MEAMRTQQEVVRMPFITTTQCNFEFLAKLKICEISELRDIFENESADAGEGLCAG